MLVAIIVLCGVVGALENGVAAVNILRQRAVDRRRGYDEEIANIHAGWLRRVVVRFVAGLLLAWVGWVWTPEAMGFVLAILGLLLVWTSTADWWRVRKAERLAAARIKRRRS